MSDKPQTASLGDEEKPEYILVKDQVPLPKGRNEKIEAFRGILQLGGVQKVVLEVGKPITFFRVMQEDKEAEIPPANAFDPIELVRLGDVANVEVPELESLTSEIPLTVLFHAFNQIILHGAVPGFFVASSPKILAKWLSKLLSKDTLFGLEIKKSFTIPDDAVFLAGVSAEDTDVVRYTVRIPLDLPKEKP